MKIKKKLPQIILNCIFVIISLLVIFPFILLVSTSLSNETDIALYGTKIIPRRIDLTAYKYVWKNGNMILQAYKVTGFVSIVSMILGTFLKALIAYPLSRQNYRKRGFIAFYLFFTMLFHGGMVSTYILITRYLHLDDTIWVYILRGLLSPWHIFMMRTFFQGVPNEIVEAARIDGMSEYGILLKMMIPLSKPVIASVALFLFLGKWNDWMASMLYITNEKLYTLQYLLQKILKDIDIVRQNMEMGIDVGVDLSEIPSETMRMAMAVVVAGPALVVFPFFQKYFAKGLTVGSVKG